MDPDRDSAQTILVRITPTIERDYERRNAFAWLRLSNAEHTMNGGSVGVHRVTVHQARELLTDAELRRRERSPRGTPKSYTALAAQLRSALPEQVASRRACAATGESSKAAAALDAQTRKLEAAAADVLMDEATFRELAVDTFWMATGYSMASFGAIELTEGERYRHPSGFRFDAALARRMQALRQEACAILREGGLTYVEPAECAAVRGLRSRTAKLDVPLQRCLRTVTANVAAGRVAGENDGGATSEA